MSKIITKLFVAIILLAIMPVVCANPCNEPDWNCNPPNNDDIFQPNGATLNSDDDYPQWSDDDFVKDMRACEVSGSSPYLAKTYVQLDDDANILYVRVLLNENSDHFITDVNSDHYVWDNCARVTFLNNEFRYIKEGSDIIGWEAAVSVDDEIYQIRVQTKLENDETPCMNRCINCGDPYPIPEFSTIALPIAAILGIMFILQSRRRKED